MIHLSNIGFTYPNGTEVLSGLELSCSKGERIGIVGANGSGKTTVLHILMGLLLPTSGSVELFGKERKREEDFRDSRQRMGFVFQDADDQLFCPTVAEDVAFGPRNLGKSAPEANDITHSVLSMLDIEHLEKSVTYQLSGGEKRLVALATALAMEPEILILDEPATGLADDVAEHLLDILDRHVPTSIVVSHDRRFLSRAVEKTLTLQAGQLKETGRDSTGSSGS